MYASNKPAPRSELVQNVIRRHNRVPVSFYGIVDNIVNVISNKNIVDAILIAVTFLAFSTSFNFYPYALIAVIAIVLFIMTQYHPLLGISLLVLAIMPVFMYQAPAMAWVFMFFITATLVMGYMHYRTISFTYLLIALAFTPLGLVLEIPALVIAVLVVGFKRASIATAVAILVVISFASVFGMSNYAYIVYNPVLTYHSFAGVSVLNYTTPSSPSLTLSGFFNTGIQTAVSRFTNIGTIGSVSTVFGLLITPFFSQFFYIVEIILFVVVIKVIDGMAVSSKSKYKGTISSLAGFGFPLSYVAVSAMAGIPYNATMPIVSALIAPLFLLILESYDIPIVKVLDVRKQDIRMKFGEAFEDLAGSSNERFEDIGNYESTKKEIKEVLLAPIEEKAISRAYGVKPAKGVLLFGPPGTGKTLIMRALANEIHAGFYYVKASNLISSLSGDTEKRVSEIFKIAKDNAPCILFFDEIDAIARKRDDPSIDSVHRSALSQLLVEMDGFQKISKVIVVGGTNVPNILDPAMMRSGRFDKIIYMPLPDHAGRKLIFQLYLSKLPVSKSLDLDNLAEATERFSGADIKNVTETVAQMIATEASTKHKILEIMESDVMKVIKSTKPSTTLAQLEEYNKFKIDFERRMYGEKAPERAADEATMDNVIGLDDAKKAIFDAIQTPLLRPDLIKKYDIKSINGILLFGPPGTGKTMLMRAVKNNMEGVTMLEMDGSDLSNMGIERANTMIKELFNRAKENKPAIIFIDEIEGLVPKREGAGEFSNQVTVEMLMQLDGIKKLSGVVVIAATNRPEKLDSAILRPGRFDKIIFIRPPKTDERALIFKDNLQKIPLSADVNFSQLGAITEGFTGADIVNVCREAKTRALDKNLKTGEEIAVSMADIKAIIKHVKPSAPELVVSAYLTFLAKYGQR